MDVFGRRPHGGQGERRAVCRGPADCRGQRGQPGDRAQPYRHAALDRPRSATACRSTPTATSSSTSWRIDGDVDIRAQRVDDLATDPGRAQRLGQARLQLGIHASPRSISSPDRVSVNGGYYRRTFGNQTFTDDLRYDANSYDCVLHQRAGRSRPARTAADTRCAVCRISSRRCSR